MDWEISYRVSRSLCLEIGRTGQLVATSSISRPAQELSLDGLPVLLAFADGATPRAALARLRETWELEEEGFVEVVEALLGQAFLVPVAADGPQLAGAALAAGGFASLLTHQHLLADTVRVMAYRNALFRHCAGKSVVEIGCGSGILSIFAVQAGARRVIAIEESEIAALAEEMFAANGCAGRIELRRANSRDVVLDEPADVLVHEILGTDPFAENLLPAILDARRRLLRPGGRLVPYRLEVCCVGLELEDRQYRDRGRLLAETRELPALYGVDFAPLLDRLAGLTPQLVIPALDVSANGRFKPKIVSEELQLLDLDLAAELPESLGQRSESRLRIAAAGRLDALALFFRAHLDETLHLSTSPYAPLTSWGHDIRALSRQQRVSPGDEIVLSQGIDSRLGRQRLMIDLA